MKKTIYRNTFISEVRAYNSSFTEEALKEIYNYLELNFGDEYEFDALQIIQSFTEYDNFMEALENVTSTTREELIKKNNESLEDEEKLSVDSSIEELFDVLGEDVRSILETNNAYPILWQANSVIMENM